MKLTVDTENQKLLVEGPVSQSYPLYGKESFEILSDLWVKAGWNQRYSYTFTWMGRPVIQLPEDMVRTQEVIHRLQPDLIIETGVAHGGSLIFYASLCKALGKGRVIGVDIEIKAANRSAIEQHLLAEFITLIEGDSVGPEVLRQVQDEIQSGDKVLVILDSDHTKRHVAAELEAYHEFVSSGSYIVATDGIMKDLWDVPGGQRSWQDDNPTAAAAEFAARHPEFVLEQPEWAFRSSDLEHNITYWPGAWLRRS